MTKPTKSLGLTVLAAMALGLGAPAQANMTLKDACARFSSKLQAAVAEGNTAKAKKIYAEGNKRVAANFNGATCPNITAP